MQPVRDGRGRQGIGVLLPSFSPFQSPILFIFYVLSPVDTPPSQYIHTNLYFNKVVSSDPLCACYVNGNSLKTFQIPNNAINITKRGEMFPQKQNKFLNSAKKSIKCSGVLEMLNIAQYSKKVPSVIRTGLLRGS